MKKVKLLFYDFDGVMTDNNVYIDQEGREMVQVNRSDGLGISEIKKLTIDNYEEKLIKTFSPQLEKGQVGIHHVTQLNDRFFYDICIKKI